MSLTAKQIKAAELLARNYSHQETADAVGTSRRSILRWLKQQDFRDLAFGLSHRGTQTSSQHHPSKPSVTEKPFGVLTAEDLVQDALQAVQSILQDSEARTCDRLKAAALVGQWAQLGLEKSKMSEMESLKALLDAGWIGDEPIKVLSENWEILTSEMKEVLRGSEPIK